MRSVFPAYFRPSAAEYGALWRDGIFALDANVLLNLYRYSSETRAELENAIVGIKDRIFVSHQAAREFLKNRIVVTASQAEEYTKATKAISDLAATIANKKKHPFLEDGELPPFLKIAEAVTKQLEAQKEQLLKRLTDDEILDFVEKYCDGHTGEAFSTEELSAIVVEGQKRYDNEIPPGYKDGNKAQGGDPNRKFGDFILWKQLINKAKADNKPLILITDDQKEDWWQEQSGRIIGPRPELREEFLKESGQDFWMYTVDRFISESAKRRKTVVSDQVIAEIIEVRQESSTKRLEEHRTRFRHIEREELIARLKNSESWAYENGVPFLGLLWYVKTYLGNAGFDYESSFDLLKELEADGVIEIYEHQGPGHEHSVSAIRLKKRDPSKSRPFEDLRKKIDTEHGE